MNRAAIVKVDGNVLAIALGLPGHTIEEVPAWGEESDDTVELVVRGPRMPEDRPGWRYEVARVLEGETVSEAIERTWPSELAGEGGN